MPKLGAHNACHHGNRHHPHRIRSDARPLKPAVHHNRAHHGGQPKHQSEGGQLEGSNVKQIGKHLSSSIDARPSPGALRPKGDCTNVSVDVNGAEDSAIYRLSTPASRPAPMLSPA